MSSRLLSIATVAALVATPLALAAPAHAAPAASATTAVPAATTSTWKPRPEQYSKTVTIKDLAIPMADGVRLRGDLTLPADANGQAIKTKVPVVVTITAYNKTVIAG